MFEIFLIMLLSIDRLNFYLFMHMSHIVFPNYVCNVFGRDGVIEGGPITLSLSLCRHLIEGHQVKGKRKVYVLKIVNLGVSCDALLHRKIR